MKTKIPPPILLLLFAVAMWFVAHSKFAFSVPIPYAIVPAVALLAVGVYFAVMAIRRFGSAETTVNPLHPETASTLVTDGIYAGTRNPMYVGLLLDLTAWAVWLQSLGNIPLLVLFVVLINELQIKPEEKALATLFGEEYEQYCRRVRRWL